MQTAVTIARENLSAAGLLVVAQNGAEIRAHDTHNGHVGPGSPIRELAQRDQVARRVNVEDRGEAGSGIDEKEAAVLRTAEASGNAHRRRGIPPRSVAVVPPTGATSGLVSIARIFPQVGSPK